MKFKVNLLILLGLICIFFIFSSCSRSEDTNISSIDRDSNIIKTEKPIINSKKK